MSWLEETLIKINLEQKGYSSMFLGPHTWCPYVHFTLTFTLEMCAFIFSCWLCAGLSPPLEKTAFFSKAFFSLILSFTFLSSFKQDLLLLYCSFPPEMFFCEGKRWSWKFHWQSLQLALFVLKAQWPTSGQLLPLSPSHLICHPGTSQHQHHKILNMGRNT